MNAFGVDTSNYTTSAAIINGDDLSFVNSRQILDVNDGEVGLRQSEALFKHVKNLPSIIENTIGGVSDITAVGVSDRPRSKLNSYMPCFLAGVSAASAVSMALGVPLYKFSHQSGHIAAALLSSGKTDLLGKRFISFHVSGGTTEAVMVDYDKDDFFKSDIIACSLDLKMGQAVDRVGNMLGLRFPAGKELDKLSLSGTLPEKPKPTLKGLNCSISGLQNKAEALKTKGCCAEDIAYFTILYLALTLDKMTEKIIAEYGDLPLVFAGGVMSNTIIRKHITSRYGAYFASAELSSDNAVGTAFMAHCKHNL